MTTEHLIAWLAENLLASVFIGSGALLALLLATWPLRALWRLWRGRKVKQRAMAEARAELTRPRATFLHIDEAQYVEAIIDTIPTGGMKSIDRPVPYGGSKPEESKRPVTCAEFEELVAMHGRMREREIERERDVDSRLAALEAKEANGTPAPVVPRTGCFVSMDDALTGGGSAQLQSLLRKMQQRMDAPDYHGTAKDAIVAEWRAWRGKQAL